MFTNFLIYIGFVDKQVYVWSGNKSRLKLHLLRSSRGGGGKMMHKRLQLVSGRVSKDLCSILTRGQAGER